MLTTDRFNMKAERAIAYIDGFNLYFGLKDSGWSCYYWLDLKHLCQCFTNDPKHPRNLISVKYFTSRVTGPPDKRKRQSTYLEALNAIGGIKPYYGKYQPTPFTCKQCGFVSEEPEEKMTDVQLATELVSDAYQNNYETAFIISGDRDLVPAVESVVRKPLNKHAIVIFPPKRTNTDLMGVATAYLHITENELKKCLLPPEIKKIGGYALKCPDSWH
jgi:uncharacterized LabA/DUF88 family protein